jgi:hypothetical protein
MLVMIPIERVCELVFVPAEKRWFIQISSPGSSVI